LINSILVLLLFVLPSILLSQDTLKTNFKHTILPIGFYLPETGVGLGATGIYTFRLKNESLESRPSQFLYSAAYTFKNQLLLYIPFQIFDNSDNIRIKGEVGFYKYFYNYYGQGRGSIESDLENYNVTYPRVDFNYSRSILKDIYLGLGLKYDYFNITKIKELGLLERNKPIGFDGGHKSNLVLLFFVDKRDHVISTSKGFYLEAELQRSLDILNSTFSYTKLKVETRYFFSLTDDIILGTQLVFDHASELTPFFDLPYIGSPIVGRGISDRRYLSNNIVSMQYEIRYPIWKKFSGVAFSSNHWISNSFSSLLNLSPKWSYGLGLRFEFDERDKTRFRLDVAKGDGNFNFYLTANEAF